MHLFHFIPLSEQSSKPMLKYDSRLRGIQSQPLFPDPANLSSLLLPFLFSCIKSPSVSSSIPNRLQMINVLPI